MMFKEKIGELPVGTEFFSRPLGYQWFRRIKDKDGQVRALREMDEETIVFKPETLVETSCDMILRAQERNRLQGRHPLHA